MGNLCRILILLGLVCVPVSAHATTCADLKKIPTKINITLHSPEPFYDFKTTLQDINKNSAAADEWLVKNGMQKVWSSKDMRMLGYAEGGAGAVSSFSFDIKKFDQFGVYYCPYIREVNLDMMFRTKIVIPKDFPQGGCRFNHVHEHELKHYQVNADVSKEFVGRLKRDLPAIINYIESEKPYIEGKDIEFAVEHIKASMRDAIDVYIMQTMPEELSRRNGLIDTPEEYASSGPKMKACKD